MSDRKDHAPLATAEATRTDIMRDLRRKAEETIGKLQHDVLHLLDEAHRDKEPNLPPIPEPSPISPIWRHGDEHRRHEQERLDADLRDMIAGIVREAVRREIAKLELDGLIKAEVDRQLRVVSTLLQERLKDATKPNAHKFSPLLSRRRL